MSTSRLRSLSLQRRASLPSLAIHLGRTKTSGADQDDVVYLTGRPVEALDAWLLASKIETGSVFRKIDRWGNVPAGRSIPAPSMTSSRSARLWLGWRLRSSRRMAYVRDTSPKLLIGGSLSLRRWNNPATAQFNRRPAIITMPIGETGQQRAYCEACTILQR